jgi:hypothetical protein
VKLDEKPIAHTNKDPRRWDSTGRHLGKQRHRWIVCCNASWLETVRTFLFSGILEFSYLLRSKRSFTVNRLAMASVVETLALIGIRVVMIV